jgi:hypothetical protein
MLVLLLVPCMRWDHSHGGLAVEAMVGSNLRRIPLGNQYV